MSAFNIDKTLRPKKTETENKVDFDAKKIYLLAYIFLNRVSFCTNNIPNEHPESDAMNSSSQRTIHYSLGLAIAMAWDIVADDICLRGFSLFYQNYLMQYICSVFLSYIFLFFV